MQGRDDFLSPTHLFFQRGLYLALGILIAARDDVVDTGHIAMEVVRGHEREHVGHSDAQRGLLAALIVRLVEGIDPGDDRQALVVATIVEGLHGSQFHRLYLRHGIGRVVAGDGGKQRGDESHDGSDTDAFDGQPALTVAEEIIGAHSHGEERANNPCRRDGVAELVDSEG